MTDRARRVMSLAEQEARRLGAAVVEPEHVLTALALEGDGVAAHVLRDLGVTVDRIERGLPGTGQAQVNKLEVLPWSAGTQSAIARAFQELEPLGHNYVGTEHLILGVVLSSEGAVPAVLGSLHVEPEAIRRGVYTILGHDI